MFHAPTTRGFAGHDSAPTVQQAPAFERLSLSAADYVRELAALVAHNPLLTMDGPASPPCQGAPAATLRDHLQRQASLLPPCDRAAVSALVCAIDDDGHLPGGVNDGEPGYALALLQSFDPPGVGARDVGECLRLQLGDLTPAERELAWLLIDEHLQGMPQRDGTAIARRLAMPRAELQNLTAAMRRLEPRPGWRLHHCARQGQAPDLLVHKVLGQWVASLNDGLVPRLRPSPHMADAWAQPGGDALLEQAHAALCGVAQRYATILAVAEAVVRRQAAFFEHGPLALRPLLLRQVAQELGLDEATVQEAATHKYLVTPVGTLELNYFFSEAAPVHAAPVATATVVRAAVREMIAAERPEQRLSDVAIAERLARQGIAVARRTVTKYRQALQLPAVDQRRAGLMA